MTAEALRDVHGAKGTNDDGIPWRKVRKAASEASGGEGSQNSLAAWSFVIQSECMATPTTAEEHLRVIRSLMEKATIYRAISVPTALVGGCAGIAAAAFFHFSWRPGDSMRAESHLFLACWLSALAIAAVGNVHFLRADARRRGEKFVSTGMRAALRALWPSYLVAATLTILWRNSAEVLPITWMLLYGLGLLGTQHFAPRSITLLGWAFLIAGLLAMVGSLWADSFVGRVDGLLFVGNLAMGLTFGGFHLIYAVCAWPRGVRVGGAQAGAVDAGNAP
jgi:hypothetical protein